MITLGLQRISQLVQPLFSQHPALSWKAIHIAGTNGKGSVAALLSSFLCASGYRVGRFTSPHLIDRWDCIALDQTTVDRDDFLRVEQEWKQRSIDHGVNASEFEILTATAFDIFDRERVDVAVIECGLGGRLDATNVLRPQDVLVSVLAKVGLDHTEFLGSTLDAIAREKAGIFKQGVPVVVDDSNPPDVLNVVSERLQQLEPNTSAERAWYRLPPRLASVMQDEGLQAMRLAPHQQQNLLTAYTAYSIAMSRLAEAQGQAASGTATPPITDSTSLSSLVRAAHTSHRGRLEWLSLPSHLRPPRPLQLLLDGAHNTQSAEALATYVNGHLRPTPVQGSSLLAMDAHGPVTWVLAMKTDKDIRSILSLWLGERDNAVICEFGPVDGMPWVKSMNTLDLANIAQEFAGGTVEVGPHGGAPAAVMRAVDMAVATSPAQSPAKICIAGSLYLVGDVLRWLRAEENTQVPRS